MNQPNRFHCCATCEHYRVQKNETGTGYHCSRLGYETKPTYQFNCWSPKPQVQRLMAGKNEPS
ncbi:hypothetical protein [Brevibacillus dissolubilis]|uniref:hypothetical protein n=1 Tax=Brevibacillus dissolubilis TaxID=1844116 RepID=UPI0011163825|nr:hypothetical protein [Brevibacillus dissolubilis]